MSVDFLGTRLWMDGNKFHSLLETEHWCLGVVVVVPTILCDFKVMCAIALGFRQERAAENGAGLAVFDEKVFFRRSWSRVSTTHAMMAIRSRLHYLVIDR